MVSHMSRSTATGKPSGAHSTTSCRPAPSMAERNSEASSAVNAGRSVGWGCFCTRPASIREKSSSALTSFSSRRPLRWVISTSWRSASSRGLTWAVSSARFSSSSSGPSISVSGVRNSWLIFEKNVVLARSISASASARRRSSS
ncbi:hypothetical protein D3C81_1405380 [compost metagenome]